MISQSVALRRVTRIINGGTPTPEPENWNGEVPWATPVDLGRTNGFSLSETGRNLTTKGALSGSTVAPKGSVLLSTRAPIGYAAINEVPMAFNQGCKALIPSDGVSARFLRYALNHIEPLLQSMGQGATFLELSSSALASVEIPLPPTEVQIRTVDFLDRETAQIDNLIGKQERLIDLLAEKRQAMIAHAVTKGLDPTAPTKPSGIRWLGDIPAHWTASLLGTWLVHKIEGGYSPTSSGIFPEEEDWGVLSLGAVGRGEFLPANVKAVDPSANVPTTLEIRDGDLLLTRSNVRERVGFAAVVGGARPKTIFPDLVYRLGVNSSMDKQYLACFLSSTPARAQIESSARGSSGTMPKISHDQIRAWRIPLPPLSEQQELVAFVRSECSKMDKVSLGASNAIGLLQERRSALISAAVTGRIDVREGAQS